MTRWICHDDFPFSKFNSSSNFWERNSSFWRYQAGWWLRWHFSFSVIQHQNNVKSYLILLHHYHVQICFITIPPIIKPPPFVLPPFPPRAPWHVWRWPLGWPADHQPTPWLPAPRKRRRKHRWRPPGSDWFGSTSETICKRYPPGN